MGLGRRPPPRPRLRPTTSFCREPPHPGPSPSAELTISGREGPAWLSERLRPVSLCARREEGFHTPLPCGTCRAGVRLTRTKVCVTDLASRPARSPRVQDRSEEKTAQPEGTRRGLGLPHLTAPQLWQGRDPPPPASSREALPCWVRLIDRLSLPGAPAERARERC